MAPQKPDDDITLTGAMSLAEMLAGERAPGPRLHDGHCHFFSTRFFELIAAQIPGGGPGKSQRQDQRCGLVVGAGDGVVDCGVAGAG